MKHLLQSPDAPAGTGAPSPAPAPGPAPAPSPAPAPGPSPAPSPAPPSEPATWRADWREAYAKDDTKKLDKLKRYQSVDAAFDAMFNAQNRIAAGELRPVLGKTPTDAELKEWREANGIPDKPDGYDLKDVKVSENGKAVVDKFLALAHKTHQTPDQVKESLKFISQMAADERAARVEKDAELEVRYEDVLRKEWGDEFRGNINLAHGILDSLVSQEFKTKILGSRLDDGTPIGSSPEMLKLLVGLALINNPAGTVVPGAGANPMKGVEDEISRIEGLMRTNRKAYDKDDKLQAQYRDLLDAREKLAARKS